MSPAKKTSQEIHKKEALMTRIIITGAITRRTAAAVLPLEAGAQTGEP